MNLPNAITIARIATTPLIAMLPFLPNWELRLVAFLLYIAAAVTDYYDGMLARTRGLVTDLGKQLDPLADKLLLLGTLLPMFFLVGSGRASGIRSPHELPFVPGVLGPMARDPAGGSAAFPFVTPFGTIGLPWWIVALVLGRELVMTVFRQMAARRGVIISAIGPAKWKTAFQSVWVGTAFFWFWAATLAAERQWTGDAWRYFAYFNGIVGVATMTGAVLLTVYSLGLYVHRYGHVLGGRGTEGARGETGRG